ncbi:hypothetical protein SKDZ_14G0940 [Saccharomyces kudriavzevii ZP591]|nr:hypothetical protein SKDZ_14G0940 [Saccharomyces kudriavzevii ZP591]
MVDNREFYSQLVFSKDMPSGNVPCTEVMMYNVSLPHGNSSSAGHVDSSRTKRRASSHDHSMRSEMSSKNSASDFTPKSISQSEDNVYQMREEGDGSPSMKRFDFKINQRDLLLLRMSWDILLKEYLTPEELRLFQRILYSNKNITSTERPYLNNAFDGMISKTLDPTLRSHKNKKKDNNNNNNNNSKVDTALFCSQFYDNLIVMDPLLEEYFPSLRHQAVSFCKVLNSAIENLEDVHILDDYIVKLGKRHSRILGIKTIGFEVMGKAFMTTLQDRFGSFFTLELKNLWGKLYSYLANCMITAGKDPMKISQPGASNRENSLFLNSSVPKLATADRTTSNKPQLVKTKNATTPNNITQVLTSKPLLEIPLENSSTRTNSDRESTATSPNGPRSMKPSIGSSTVVESSSKKNNYEEKIHLLQRTAHQKNCSIM